MTVLTDKPHARPALSLDGAWSFTFKGPTARLAQEPVEIRSPGVWQAQFPALRNACGTGRYQRRVDVPKDWRGRAVILTLEGVFHSARVFVDGRLVGTHDNAWTACEFDLTAAIGVAATFELVIEAHVPDDRDVSRESFGETLAAKQDWYGIQGGIWKSARIEARAINHLRRVVVQTLGESVQVRGQANGRVALALSHHGAPIVSQEIDAAGPFEVVLDVAAPQHWSPDAPHLYDLAITLSEAGAPVDRLVRTVGFRRFEARDGRLFLNGEPFFMFGALDQDWHPIEECRPPDPAFLEQRFRNAKAMGLNTLRCHVKIPDPLYFDLADRLGLVIWLDMPYMEFLTPRARETIIDTFEGAVEAHAHHPSIAIWTLFNEGWGIDLDDDPDDRAWLLATFDAAKRRVPESLVVDNSPCFPRNYHVKSDIEDFHWYNAFPSQNQEFAQRTQDFAKRATWPWSPHGDAVKTGEEPLICSEFGVWGLPHPSDLLEDGKEPWWFESGHDWNQGAAYPHGIETRFRDAQLAPIFGDLDGFVDAAQESQYRGLKYQIEILRWSAPISGYVITELNDTQWECNGLMDAQNNPRRFADRLAQLQRPYLAIARAARTALHAGESITASIRLAGAGAAPEGGWIDWRFGPESGRIPATAEPVAVSFRAGAEASPCLREFEIEAFDAAGAAISRNRLEFCVAPAISERAPALWAADAEAAAILDGLDWPQRAPTPDEADVCLATRLTTPVREGLLAGRKTLLIANQPDALVDPERSLPAGDLHNFPTMGLRARAGSPWDGGWMGAFCWRRIDGPWSALPGGAMLDEHWVGLLPDYVLTGFRSTAFGGLVDAGVTVAWLHKTAAFTKRSFLGKAWMTVSTFDFSTEAARRHPLAPHLLLALAQS